MKSKLFLSITIQCHNSIHLFSQTVLYRLKAHTDTLDKATLNKSTTFSFYLLPHVKVLLQQKSTDIPWCFCKVKNDPNPLFFYLSDHLKNTFTNEKPHIYVITNSVSVFAGAEKFRYL